ncbi:MULTISPECIES: tubby C-terminal domain-like protein [Bacillaceae]|uniref:Tubby C-terminal domain-containing protein n=1 Tax=Sutcliffiella horikoshii TaxID=79883 RepID=A0A5D4T8G0_9BACI|nr:MULTISPECIES: hypothetical protein [Bacillaceae]TYS71181.1 hypothetical protein FZC75_14210 [Sutcliffiella horikoshii]
MIGLTFTLPLFKHSAKPIPILDSQGNQVASFNRTYRKKWVEVVSKLPIPILSEGVQAFFEKKDLIGVSHNGETIKVEERPFKENLFKPKWDVTHTKNSGEEETYFFQDITKIKTHGRFIYNKNNRQFTLEKNLMDGTTYIKEDGVLITEIARVRSLPSPSYIIKSKEMCQISLLEIAVLHQICHLQLKD